MNNLSGRLVIYLVGLASIFLILSGIRQTASILNPILLATVITITALPIPGRLMRRNIPGWLALLLTILAVVLLLGLVIMTVFFSVTRLSVELPVYMADAAASAAQVVPAEVMGLQTPVSTTQLTIQFRPVVQSIAATILNVLVQFGMALFIFFFMISAAMSLPGAVRLGLDPSSPVISRLSELTEDVRQYMGILTGINFLVGMGNAVFLLFLGVDYALLWGLLAWFMGYIPSIGFIIALIPPVLLAYAQYGLSTAVVVLIGYVLINGSVQNFIQPKIMGQGLKINAVVVFVGLFIWGYLLGGIGALLAVPLTLLILTVMDNFEGTHALAILMRYTGEDKKDERQEAARQVKGLWGKVRDIYDSAQETKDTLEES
jgi:AI-2 transport protein TqsA